MKFALPCLSSAILFLLAFSVGAQTTPSLVLEGQGSLGPTTLNCASGPTCSGQFTATLSGQLSQTVSAASLQLEIVAQNPAPEIKRLKAKGATGKLEAQIEALQQEIDSLRAGGAPSTLPFPVGCFSAVGAGSFLGSQYDANFVGQLCDSGSQVALSGTIWIVQAPLTPAVLTWATGTLVASGALHIFSPNNLIPASGPMVTSIVGAAGRIPGIVP